jgi:hypothetical protein
MKLGDLPIAKTNSGWATSEQVEMIALSISEAILASDSSIDYAGGKVTNVQLNAGVFSVSLGYQEVVSAQSHTWIPTEWPPINDAQEWKEKAFYARPMAAPVIRSLARGWGVTLADVVKASLFYPHEERREIGRLMEKPFMDEAAIICRPM